MTKDKQHLLELIGRLKATRAGCEVSTGKGGGLIYVENDQRIIINPDGPEAAEAIQSILVENERLEALVEKLQAGNRARFAANHSPHPSRR